MLLSFNTDIMLNVRLIGHIAYKSPWSHFTRTINEYILYVIKSGELYIQEGDRRYHLKKGDILFLEPNIVHFGYQASCCDYYYIHFKHHEMLRVDDRQYNDKVQEMLLKRKLSLTSDFLLEEPPTDAVCYLPKNYSLVNESEFMYILKETTADFYNRYENYKRLVSCKMLSMLIKISREYTTTNIENLQAHFPKAFIKARKILNYLNTEYQKKISSTDIEQIFESDFDYLNRVFHKMSGYTIFNYLNMVKINKAKELIETTSMKFSEIGYLVGIDDPYYFSKLFKKYSGKTPTQYLEEKTAPDRTNINQVNTPHGINE
jgi:Response regulator containing CheY-like receiver domain and AraC-type DNA-binding domain